MSYTNSAAGIGLGTLLSINTGTTQTPVWTTVGEIKNITQSGRQVATEDVTNMQSSAREFIPTLLDSGTWKIDCSYISGDAGQQAMESAFQSLTLKMFEIQLPKTSKQTSTGDLFAFSALVQDINHTISVEKATMLSATIKVSGPITLTAGS